MHDTRLLILMNPGRQSRFYLLGIASAAERLGIPTFRIDLGPVWAHLDAARRAGPDPLKRELFSVQTQLASRVRRDRITHVLGYGFNGTHDLGLLVDRGDSPSRPPRTATLFSGLGLKHLLLWTDHPEWMVDGVSLRPPFRELLAHPNHFHFLKSESAAAEAAAILRWPNVHHLDMAEDFSIVRPTADAARNASHDAAMILGGADAPPAPARPFLDHPDPDPAAIDRAMRPSAMEAWSAALPTDSPPGAREALPAAWLGAKSARPLDSYWRVSQDLRAAHGEALDWLASDSQRWYAGVKALRRMVAWRRSFWPAWLARRVDLGISGCDASAIGVKQSPAELAWVNYTDQPHAYARGHSALNINAAHDEEGMTHKPFQIAASGIPCIHHRTRGIEQAFREGSEIALFTRGPELLDAVQRLASNPGLRAGMAEAVLARARRDHTWDRRLETMLAKAETTAHATVAA